MVMFGFLIALPGGKKIRGGGDGGRAAEPGVLCSIHSLLHAVGRGPASPMHLHPVFQGAQRRAESCKASPSLLLFPARMCKELGEEAP